MRGPKANRIAPEQKKRKQERGKYLHPELFGRKAVAVHPATDSASPVSLMNCGTGGRPASAVDRGGAGLTKNGERGAS